MSPRGETERQIGRLCVTTFGTEPLKFRRLRSAWRYSDYEVSYEEKLGEERLPAALETALFRVSQEAFTNERKHDETDRERVAFGRRADGTIRLEVRDWGAGFEPARATGGGGPDGRVGALPHEREPLCLAATS